MFVKSRMTTNPFTVTPETTIPDAIELMAARKIRHLPVVQDGAVVGVLSRGDIRAASPSQATSLSVNELTYLMSKLKVSKVMTRNPVVIGPDALLEEAAVLMRDNKIEMLPVIEAGHLVGVITESALLDSFIDLLGFRDSGTRFTIEAKDSPGTLAELGALTAAHGTNVQHVAVYRGEGGSSTVVLGVNSRNTDDLEADLTRAGFTILAKLQN